MEIAQKVKILTALAQEERLKIIYELVNSSEEGLCPCHLVERLNLSNANLSFHLKELKNADLITSQRKGKFIFYRSNCDIIKQLGDELICGCTKYSCVCEEK